MKQKGTPRVKQLVFSRWSRKGYAILSSLGKCVRIAQLKVSICKVALLKSSALSEYQAIRFMQGAEGSTSPNADEPPHDDGLLAEMLLALLAPQQVTCENFHCTQFLVQIPREGLPVAMHWLTLPSIFNRMP